MREVIDDDRERIGKGGDRLFEGDPMLLVVASSLLDTRLSEGFQPLGRSSREEVLRRDLIVWKTRKELADIASAGGVLSQQVARQRRALSAQLGSHCTEPATCLVATLSRFQTLMLAIERRSAASAGSS
jgi:hypothetical protein